MLGRFCCGNTTRRSFLHTPPDQWECVRRGCVSTRRRVSLQQQQQQVSLERRWQHLIIQGPTVPPLADGAWRFTLCAPEHTNMWHPCSENSCGLCDWRFQRAEPDQTQTDWLQSGPCLIGTVSKSAVFSPPPVWGLLSGVVCPRHQTETFLQSLRPGRPAAQRSGGGEEERRVGGVYLFHLLLLNLYLTRRERSGANSYFQLREGEA